MKQIIKLLEPYYYKVISKKIINDFSGNIYNIQKAYAYELKSVWFSELDIFLYESLDKKFRLFRFEYNSKWNIMSYDNKSIEKTVERNEAMQKIFKIAKKYTKLTNEKEVLLQNLRQIAARKRI